MKTHWIDASEVPPISKEASMRSGCDRSETVLVWDSYRASFKHIGTDKYCIRMGYFLYGLINEWRFLGENGNAGEDITFWMPLPNPPEK